jgi:N6-L-threonylcarbamoyladenine synthase
LSNPNLTPPYTALAVSGGHTHIYKVEEPLRFELIGRTVDDAAGETFDKVAKSMGGGYPGGAFIEDMASRGDALSIKLPAPMKNSLNFSFSGLKTAVLNLIAKNAFKLEDIAASFQLTAAEILAEKTIMAAKLCGHKKVVAAGGVAANSVVRERIAVRAEEEGLEAYFPSKNLCGDNAAMIAYAAYRITIGKDLSAYRRLDFKAGDTMHEIPV